MKKMNLELSTPELEKIEPSKAAQIKKTFLSMSEMLEAFEREYNDLIERANKGITPQIINEAKRLRLDIAQVRIKTDEVRKDEKNQYLIAGRAIDGVANILKWAVSEKEANLKKIELTLIRLEAEKRKQLQEKREKNISKYLEDAHERDLSSMDEDVWKAYLIAKKQAYLDRIEAEKKAEKDRIEKEKAEKAERLRIEKENTRLKKEAEEREKAEKIRLEKERKEREETQKKEREEREAREKKEREEKAKQDAIIKAERDKREKAERELKAHREKEVRKQAEREAKIQADLSKGDAQKVKDLIQDLESIKEKYSFKSVKNKAKMDDVKVLIDKVINHIKK